MISIQKLRDMNLNEVADELEQLRKFKAEIERQTAVLVTSAVAAQHRFRRPEKTMPDWSSWQPSEVNYSRPSYEVDSQGYEVEYRLLYEHPVPANQPERITDEMISRAMSVVIGSSGDYGTYNDYLSKDSAREVLEAAFSAELTSQKPARITEQDMREICTEYNNFRMNGHGMTPPEIINKWLRSEGRTLLNKLNADREPVPEVTVPDALQKLRLEVAEAINILAMCGDKTPVDQLGKKLAAALNASAPSHSQQSAEVVPLESIESLREYINEWGDDADIQVVKSELGEMILRAKGTYGCSSHDREQG